MERIDRAPRGLAHALEALPWHPAVFLPGFALALAFRCVPHRLNAGQLRAALDASPLSPLAYVCLAAEGAYPDLRGAFSGDLYAWRSARPVSADELDDFRATSREPLEPAP